MDTNPFEVAQNQPAPTAKQFQCPECPASFDYVRVLGSHRRRRHGVVGSSAGAILARAVTANRDAQVVAAKRPVSRPLGSYKKTEEQALEPVRTTSAVPDVLVGYAIGKYESLIEGIAREHNLPVTEFKIRCGMMMSTGIQVKL